MPPIIRHRVLQVTVKVVVILLVIVKDCSLFFVCFYYEQRNTQVYLNILTSTGLVLIPLKKFG